MTLEPTMTTVTEGSGCIIDANHDYDDRDVECQSPNPECWGGT
jgi:hypothetical protein